MRTRYPGFGWWLMASALLAMLAAAGCGGSSDPERVTVVDPALPGGKVEREIATAIRVAQEAYSAGDLAEACRHLSRRARFEAGEGGHLSSGHCGFDMEKWMRAIRDGGFYDDAHVTAVQVSGSRATVTIAEDVRHPYDLRMVREAGEWKIDSFFPIARARARAWAANQAISVFPPADRAAVTATDEDGTPCPPIARSSDARLTGGCRLKLRSRGAAPIMIATPVGELNISNCLTAFNLRVDSHGRTWSDGIEFSLVSGDPFNACGDFTSCARGRKPGTLAKGNYYRGKVPQPGRIRGDGQGGFVHVSDVCIRSCVGYFVGELAVELIPEGSGWRGRVPDAGVGNTGIRFEMPLRVQALDGLRLRLSRPLQEKPPRKA